MLGVAALPLRAQLTIGGSAACYAPGPPSSAAPGGDLVAARVETPVKLTREQRELLQQFEATFEGEKAAAHSPLSNSWLDGVKRFWDRVTS